MTTETQIIVRAAPNALGAAGPSKPHADALAPSHEEEKPPAPASTKHSRDPEEAKDASASKKPANDSEGAGGIGFTEAREGRGQSEETTRFQELTASATKAKTKKTPASSKPPRRTKKVNASSKPVPKKPAVKKHAAK
ncbi:hypothetical protein PF010_g13916 [Phytophthora fragariae]|uniref:Uncharacterized protein n=1 Tax=Phytophthora fragariae TaxID=53985 RepID=A0A6A4D6K7_9STRA|nr:hypothetical protein PF003_g36878 [Phytophthora fragariae]KAE8934438.1 hypothetical protein PF009_g15585 [Phytophthora fragariae]KAE8996549.1 hypothetical protein PF011_g15854 [Phytophthora fragariae]KAE9073006.1 hypothetical protein PF007_g25971 [Phytophthora fragariae]KAE9102980.1 hypothetical protein PF010_g13916 [Phytophthora fragariae]